MYNPYLSYLPYVTAPARTGLLSGLFGRGINFSTILSGAGKALNVANQAIPIIKQASPLVKNAKTMLSVMSEFKKVNTPVTTPETNVTEAVTDDSPTFFA